MDKIKEIIASIGWFLLVVCTGAITLVAALLILLMRILIPVIQIALVLIVVYILCLEAGLILDHLPKNSLS